MSLALQFANRMLDMGPRAVSNNKELVYRGATMDPTTSMRFGSALEQNLRGLRTASRVHSRSPRRDAPTSSTSRPSWCAA